jgi:uncharacterized membrane protein YozB (DUF420 family)
LLTDIVSDLTLTFSVSSMFLLVLGLPLVRGMSNKRNLKRHGILTVIALTLQGFLIFVIMVPAFINHFSNVIALPPLFSFDTWLHVALGLGAFGSGIAYVGLWLIFYSSGMRCGRAKKYMIPTLIVWMVAIVTGASIYLLSMF